MLQLNIALCIAIFQDMNYIMQRFEQCIYFYVKKLCVSNNVFKDNLVSSRSKQTRERFLECFFGLIIFTTLT